MFIEISDLESVTYICIMGEGMILVVDWCFFGDIRWYFVPSHNFAVSLASGLLSCIHYQRDMMY